MLFWVAACSNQPSPAPDSAALLAQAREAVSAGELQRGDDLLVSLLDREPEHQPALVARGQIAAMQARFTDAAEIYVRLAELRPNNGRYALHAGSYLEVMGRSVEAGRYLQRAVEQRPQDADAHFRLGLQHFNLGNDPAAETALRRSWELAPGRRDVGVKLAQSLERLARAEEALLILDAVVEHRLEAPMEAFIRGLIRSRSGRLDGAIEDLAFVVEADPDLHRARYALARALLAAGREAEGRREMERFISEDTVRRERETARDIAQLAGASSDDNPAVYRRRMEELVMADPENPETNRLLAAAYAREGDNQSAETAYARAARLDPEDAHSRRERGRLLLALERPREAFISLEEAATLRPDDSLTHRLLEEARRRATPGSGSTP